MEKDALFLGQRNEGVQTKTTQHAVWRFAKKTGVKNVTPHTLRHCFAKALINAGVSLEMATTLLKHSNQKTTRIYI